MTKFIYFEWTILYKFILHIVQCLAELVERSPTAQPSMSLTHVLALFSSWTFFEKITLCIDVAIHLLLLCKILFYSSNKKTICMIDYIISLERNSIHQTATATAESTLIEYDNKVSTFVSTFEPNRTNRSVCFGSSSLRYYFISCFRFIQIRWVKKSRASMYSRNDKVECLGPFHCTE